MAQGNIRITGEGSSAQSTIARLNAQIRTLRNQVQQTSGSSQELGRVMAQAAQNANMQGAQQAIRATSDLVTSLSSTYNTMGSNILRMNNSIMNSTRMVTVALTGQTSAIHQSAANGQMLVLW